MDSYTKNNVVRSNGWIIRGLLLIMIFEVPYFFLYLLIPMLIFF